MEDFLMLQARAHLHAPGELTLGLHLVNSTNLDYFQPQHQAELFRLKGQFLQALGERDQANSNYSTALTIWDQLPDGWLSWGSHCDEMYENSGNHAWLEYAVSCYLQAVKHGSCAGRTMLPRVLHLLSFENEGGAVGRALDRKLNEVCCCLIPFPFAASRLLNDAVSQHIGMMMTHPNLPMSCLTTSRCAHLHAAPFSLCGSAG